MVSVETKIKDKRSTWAIWAAGILVVLVSVFAYIQHRETQIKDKEIQKLNRLLISEEEGKQAEILKATQEVEERLRSLEQQLKKARTNETETLRNFEPLDAAAARIFVTEYAKTRRAETGSDRGPDRP